MEEKYCCTKEQGKQLQELGIKKEPMYYWWKDDFGDWIVTESFFENEVYPAYTIGELGEMLPDRVTRKISGRIHFYDINCYKDPMRGWAVSMYDMTGGHPYGKEIAETEAQARAEMLIYLLENKLIKPEEL